MSFHEGPHGPSGFEVSGSAIVNADPRLLADIADAGELLEPLLPDMDRLRSDFEALKAKLGDPDRPIDVDAEQEQFLIKLTEASSVREGHQTTITEVPALVVTHPNGLQFHDTPKQDQVSIGGVFGGFSVIDFLAKGPGGEITPHKELGAFLRKTSASGMSNEIKGVEGGDVHVILTVGNPVMYRVLPKIE